MITFNRALVMIVVGMSFTFCSPQRLVAQFALGDVDGDNDVDNFDLMVILRGQGQIGSFSDVDGDFDTDAGDYDIAKASFDPGFAFGNFLAAPPASANSAKLIYNAANGALLLDQSGAAGGVLSAFLLQSNAAFNVVNPVGYPFATAPKNLATRTSSLLAQADPAAATSPPGLPVNPRLLGNLLPPGLDLVGLNALSLRGVYTGQISGQPAGSHLQTFQLVVVPEPAAVSLALTAAFAVSAARRRRGGITATGAAK